MVTQATKIRRAKRDKAKAEASIRNHTAEAIAAANDAPATTKAKRKGIEVQVADAGTTKEAIEQARDRDGLSWADVAKVVGLSSPGAARKAYELLTNRSHATSIMTGKRAPKGSRSSRAGVARPEWNNDSEEATITDAVEGRRIYRKPFFDGCEPEELLVAKVLYYDTLTGTGKPMDLTITFKEGLTGASRSVFVKDIVEVR